MTSRQLVLAGWYQLSAHFKAEQRQNKGAITQLPRQNCAVRETTEARKWEQGKLPPPLAWISCRSHVHPWGLHAELRGTYLPPSPTSAFRSANLFKTGFVATPAKKPLEFATGPNARSKPYEATPSRHLHINKTFGTCKSHTQHEGTERVTALHKRGYAGILEGVSLTLDYIRQRFAANALTTKALKAEK